MSADRHDGRAGRGRVVLLTGASSSGKSSIAAELLPLLEGPWFLVPVDAVGALRSVSGTPQEPTALAEVLERTRRGYHRVVAALISVGIDVVMDYPLSERWRVDDLAAVLRGTDVVVVEVRCSMEELRRREAARGDRPVGLAESQAFVYRHGVHDLIVDTTESDARSCARTIAAALPALRGTRALDRWRTGAD